MRPVCIPEHHISQEADIHITYRGGTIMKSEWTTPVIEKLSSKNTEGGIFDLTVETDIYKSGS